MPGEQDGQNASGGDDQDGEQKQVHTLPFRPVGRVAEDDCGRAWRPDGG
ncbi:hypothetical protein DESC_270036 [Desulfosarcina cetonica]|nr:hypothetical protein DESC_270036 [Desulfosarcina cetonica]